MDIDKLGIFIQERRKALNLTQQDLADQIGVTNKAVSKWERGQSLPDITLFKAIAKSLEVETIDLFSAGDLMEKDQVEKKEVESIMEKAYEVVLSFNMNKIIKYSYILVMAACALGIFVTNVVDYVLNGTMTWSVITNAAIGGAMVLLTVIRFTYENPKKAIILSVITSILIAIPILYSVGYYIDDTAWILNEVFPVLIGSIGAFIITYIYYVNSNQTVWVKVHISAIILIFLTTAIQFVIMKETWPVLGNAISIIVLCVTLPLTIKRSKNKEH